MDYTCGKSGGCSWFCHAERHTDVDERFTPATLVSMNNDNTENKQINNFTCCSRHQSKAEDLRRHSYRHNIV